MAEARNNSLEVKAAESAVEAVHFSVEIARLTVDAGTPYIQTGGPGQPIDVDDCWPHVATADDSMRPKRGLSRNLSEASAPIVEGAKHKRQSEFYTPGIGNARVVAFSQFAASRLMCSVFFLARNLNSRRER